MDNKDKTIMIRVTEEEKKFIENKAREHGFRFIAEYVRIMCLKGKLEIK